MAITLKVSDNTAVEFTTETNEAVFLEANNSGATLTAEESESVLMSVESADVTLEAEPCIYVGGTGTPYSGVYDVTPKAWEEQVLETAQRYLSRDIKVYEVPYYETSNPSGETVYIASEV